MPRRRGGVCVPSLLAGLALAASLPPLGWWPLAFFGAALLSWRLGGLGWHARLLSGWLAGLAWFVPALWWASSFNWYGAGVLMAAEALAPALGALLVPRECSGWSRVLAFSGAFTLAEVLRCSWPFGGLPIGSSFLGQAQGPLLDVARLGGPYLLGACVFLGGAGIAELFVGTSHASAKRTRDHRPRAPWGRSPSAGVARAKALTGTLALAVVAAIGVAGFLSPDGGPGRGERRVALVQGGGRLGTREAQVAPASVFSAQVAASRPLLSGVDGARLPSLVVWPEDVVRVGPDLAGTPQAATLSALARRLDATVVAGVTETLSRRAYRNEAVAWGPGGRMAGVYEKVHRVPFGEYVPYRGFFSHLANLSGVPRDAVPGRGTGLLTTPVAPLGVMVSFETFFSARGRSPVRAGARLLVVPTNTASYSGSQIPDDELDADRLQAVEEGRDLVQASPTGYSAVVDENGTVSSRSALGARALLEATVTLRAGATPYELAGDLPVEGAAALALLVGLALGALEARARRWRPARRPQA